MANQSGITWRVEDHTKAAIEALQAARQRALKKVGAYVQGDAKRRCPKDTGRLRQSIAHTEEETATHIGTNVHYAIYVEKGTGRYAEEGNGRPTPWFYKDAKGEGHFTYGQHPQPFLTPAVENGKTQIQGIVKEEYGRIGK